MFADERNGLLIETDGSYGWISRGLCAARCTSPGKFGERLTKQRTPFSLIKNFLGNPCRICDGYTGTVSGFSPSISFLSCKFSCQQGSILLFYQMGAKFRQRFLPSHENEDPISQHQTYHSRKFYSVANFRAFPRVTSTKVKWTRHLELEMSEDGHVCKKPRNYTPKRNWSFSSLFND